MNAVWLSRDGRRTLPDEVEKTGTPSGENGCIKSRKLVAPLIGMAVDG